MELFAVDFSILIHSKLGRGMYVCMYVWRQRAALGPLWCPQPTFRFEGHKGDIRVRRTEQAGELFNDTPRNNIARQVIDPASVRSSHFCKDLTAGPVRFRNRPG